jgi:methylthioribose-1-phosphate isomerase
LAVQDAPPDELEARFEAAFARLGATRPTAVNLIWALERGRRCLEQDGDLRELCDRLIREQEEADRSLASHGAELLRPGDRVLTYCNTGPLATGGFGTAGGVITAAFNAGRLSHVWSCETRPLLQGARLTAWELDRAGIPFELVTDNSAGSLMARGLVDRVLVGADRIAANGDVANKIGTYGLAVLAARHEIPFYVAAPRSTIDLDSATGAEIPIEERDADEVTTVAGIPIAPAGAPARNLAFDVTPAELVAAIVTEAGVLEPPSERSIAAACREPV